ncbi:hypothetical protein GGTG_08808 [Gaeumannomyces tritici R3-111a-1]|uniref:Uncharacterized protein n=1 Tax=Gaeumannomyces tritici (strain R3-111a-1) TaxID=644352 RepID=J3P5L8_GAET3|nr:hypothetical protein GGTG_08808 [Gaeumannomyces tritici R3-111a-1]EJT74970.1 hypothetical protein GGTG_08808 [Gaeumannomyces tritici R3-111a-1]
MPSKSAVVSRLLGPLPFIAIATTPICISTGMWEAPLQNHPREARDTSHAKIGDSELGKKEPGVEESWVPSQVGMR